MLNLVDAKRLFWQLLQIFRRDHRYQCHYLRFLVHLDHYIPSKKWLERVKSLFMLDQKINQELQTGGSARAVAVDNENTLAKELQL